MTFEWKKGFQEIGFITLKMDHFKDGSLFRAEIEKPKLLDRFESLLNLDYVKA